MRAVGGHLNDVLDFVLGPAAAAALRDVLLRHLRMQHPATSCHCKLSHTLQVVTVPM